MYCVTIECPNNTETSLQFSEIITFFAMSHIYRCHQQRDMTDTRCLGCIIYTIYCTGQNRTLWHPCLYILWRRHFTFVRDSEFSLKKKRANKLQWTHRSQTKVSCCIEGFLDIQEYSSCRRCSVSRLNCCWFCQHSHSWLQSPRDLWPRFLFSPRHVRVSKWDLLFDEGEVGLCA
jgi:hypothetical protein